MKGISGKRHPLRDEGGQTVIELVITIAILLILLSGVLFFFDFGFRNFKVAQSKGVLSQDSDAVMEKMIRQIRVANKFSVPSGSGWATNTYPICFQGDIYGDGTPRTVMFYQTSDNQLMMNNVTDSITTALVPTVSALQFNYYDSSGVALGTVTAQGTSLSTISDLTKIKTVQIKLTMTRPVAGQSAVSNTRTGIVVIRSELTSLEPTGIEIPGWVDDHV